MNINSRTILIGPTGFLGPAFLEYDEKIIAVGRNEIFSELKNEFIQIEGVDDFNKLASLDFDNVIFLIGCSDHERLNKAASLAIEKNVIPLQKFLFWLRQSGKPIRKIITFTTMLQYDTTKMQLPCDEGQPLSPWKNNYVLSKYFAEQISAQYREWFEIIDIRISNVYGPTRLKRPDLVPSVIWQLLEHGRASVWTKAPARDFVWVGDAINATLRLIETNYSGVVNVGSGVARSVSDLTEILGDLSGIEIADQGKTVSGHMEFRHDLRLLKKLIGEYKPLSLEEGLRRTYMKMRRYHEERY